MDGSGGENRTLRTAVSVCRPASMPRSAARACQFYHSLLPPVRTADDTRDPRDQVCRRLPPVKSIPAKRSPPIIRRMKFLPQQPDFAGVFGEQVFTGKAHGHGKSFGAFAHQHYVSGVLHHGLRHQRYVLPEYCAPRPTPDRHGAAGPTSYNRRRAQPPHIFEQIPPRPTVSSHQDRHFRAFHDPEGGVERIATAFREGKAFSPGVHIRYGLQTLVTGGIFSEHRYCCEAALGRALFPVGEVFLFRWRLLPGREVCTRSRRERHIPPACTKAGSISRDRAQFF